MKKKLKISSFILLTTLLLLIISEIIKFIPHVYNISLMLAFGIVVINFLLFIASILFSVRKSNKIFLILVLGGLILRLFIVLLLVFLVLIYLKVDQYAFIFGLLIWYVLLLVFEIGIVKDTFTKAEKLT